jgi:hypothetical protein
MHAGGRVLLLDDYGTGDGLLTRFGIRRVPLPGQPAEMLRGNPALAIAEAASAHPAVRDVARVVTNHATGLAQQGLSPLLVVHGDREPDVLLAVAGAVGQGRFLAVGDASIAMNAMLRYPGNRALSLALIRYAAEDDVWGTRGGKLYVLTNDFDTTGTFGDSSRAGSTLGETRRTLLEALETLRRDGMPPLAAYLVALAVALGVVAWTSTRAGKTHKPSTPRFVRPVPVVAQGGVAGHAATIGAPGTARLLAMLELKSALEEQLAARLDLARAPSHEELVARVRAAGLLDEANVGELSRTLASLMRIEATFMTRRGAHAARVRDADVVAMASRVRGLLDLVPPVGSAPRDRVGEHP